MDKRRAPRTRAQTLEDDRKDGHASRRPRQMKSRQKRSSIALPILTLALLAFVGGYWHVFGSPFEFAMSPRTMATLGEDMAPASDKHVNDLFDMDGVQLGMSLGMVRRLHPAAHMIDGRNGERVLKVSTPRGMLVAWLYEGDKYIEVDGELVLNERNRIYRMRLDEAYADLSEGDLMKKYGRAYGRPMETTCERNQLGDTPRCTYRWWGGDGIELTAIMKQKLDAKGKAYVLLTTIATNTQKTAHQAKALNARTRG